MSCGSTFLCQCKSEVKTAKDKKCHRFFINIGAYHKNTLKFPFSYRSLRPPFKTHNALPKSPTHFFILLFSQLSYPFHYLLRHFIPLQPPHPPTVNPPSLSNTLTSSTTSYFLNQDSLHAQLKCHYEAWSYKKNKHKKIKSYRKSVLRFEKTYR